MGLVGWVFWDGGFCFCEDLLGGVAGIRGSGRRLSGDGNRFPFRYYGNVIRPHISRGVGTCSIGEFLVGLDLVSGLAVLWNVARRSRFSVGSFRANNAWYMVVPSVSFCASARLAVQEISLVISCFAPAAEACFNLSCSYLQTSNRYYTLHNKPCG